MKTRTITVHFVEAMVVVASYFAVVFFQRHGPLETLYREDGIVENAAVAGYLICAMTFGSLFWSIHKSDTLASSSSGEHSIVYLLFAALFLFAAGEEISWGQRLIGWETPASLRQVNNQLETNLHNMAILDGKLDVAFHLFCVGYLFALPMFEWIFPGIVPMWIKRRLPIPPLWFGYLTVLNIAVGGFVFNSNQYAEYVSHAAGELRETIQAFIFASFARTERKNVNFAMATVRRQGHA